jgi:hypothetical protein
MREFRVENFSIEEWNNIMSLKEKNVDNILKVIDIKRSRKADDENRINLRLYDIIIEHITRKDYCVYDRREKEKMIFLCSEIYSSLKRYEKYYSDNYNQESNNLISNIMRKLKDSIKKEYEMALAVKDKFEKRYRDILNKEKYDLKEVFFCEEQIAILGSFMKDLKKTLETDSIM